MRGHDEERLFQFALLAAGSDLFFLHGFEEGGLRFWRGAVDFIGKDDLREDRAMDEGECPMSRSIFHDHVGANDVRGHQVGGELDAGEFEVQSLGE